MVAVRLQDIPDRQEQKGLPEYVEKLLEFWGAWLRGVRLPDLGLPHETPEARVAREQNGERYREEMTRRLDVIPETRGIHTLADSIGLKIDNAIESLTPIDARLSAVIVYRYLHGIPGKIACKRIHTSEDVHDRLLLQARWFLAAELKPLRKHTE